MLGVALQMARARVPIVLALAFAVLGGAALVAGAGVLAETGLRSHPPAGRLAGAGVLVAAPQTVRVPEDLPIGLPERAVVPEALVGQLARVPGVAAAVGDLSFPAALVDRAGRVVPTEDPRAAGHGWSSARIAPGAQVVGAAPGPGQVALERGLASAAGVRVGDTVRVLAAGRPTRQRVSALVAGPGLGILFADGVARGLAGRERGARANTVDLVALRTAPGEEDAVAQAVRDRLGASSLEVVTGDERGDVRSPGAAAQASELLVLAGSFAGTVLLIVGFMVAGAVGVVVAAQRRELALMRAVGATPRQVRRLIGDQATLVAALAAVPGTLLGYVLAGQGRALLVDLEVIGPELELAVSPAPALATFALLVGVVALAARVAARKASRMPATEAVAESRVEPRRISPARTATGAGLVLGALALSATPLGMPTALGASATSIAGILAAIGLALAAPALIRRAGDALVARLGEGVPVATWLAAANVRAHALRAAGAVATLAMAVVFVLTYVFAQTTLESAGTQEARAGTLAQHSLRGGSLGGVPGDLPARARETPGVRSAVPVSQTSAVWSSRLLGETTPELVSALVLTPDAADVLDLGVREGSLRQLRGDAVALASDVAAAQGAEVGDRVAFRLADGSPVRARVVALYERGLGFGELALSRDLVAGHTSGLDDSVLVRTDGSAAAQRALADVAGSVPGVALDTGEAATGASSGTSAYTWINLGVVAVLLGYVLLGVANSLVATTAQRRGEIASLRLLGATPRQVIAMGRREAGLTAAGAALGGLALSAVPLALLGLAFLDRPWPGGPVWLAPAAVLTVGVVAFLTTELPIRHALRTPPAATLVDRG